MENGAAMRRALLLAPGVVLLGAVLLEGGDGGAPATAGDADVHLGAGSCAATACHGGTEDRRNEHTAWRQHDRHAQAYLALLEPLGVQIARRLRFERPAHETPACLACHGTDPESYRLGERFDARDGVSCEICHGGSSRWLGPHAAPGWAAKPASEKAALGMRDLTTAASRARLCVDCHVGSPDGRGVVTHDFLAAGHPPLEFDAAAFQDAMPPHWTDEADLDEPLWVVGQALGTAAKLDAAARAPEDYAHMECASCHHALDPNGYYARREPPGPAGRPRLDTASLLVVERVLGVPLELSDDRATWTAAADRARAAAEGSSGGRGGRLEAWLRAIAAGEESVPAATARQLAFAVRALSPGRASPEFREAYGALGRMLAPEVAYDPVAVARAALAAFEAGRAR